MVRFVEITLKNVYVRTKSNKTFLLSVKASLSYESIPVGSKDTIQTLEDCLLKAASEVNSTSAVWIEEIQARIEGYLPRLLKTCECKKVIIY